MTASTFRDGLRALADSVRSIPGALGMREHSATLLHDTWSGAQPGEGTDVQRALPITVGGGQNPKVRWLGQKELAIAGLPEGIVEIGPFTPSNSAGGIAASELLGTDFSQGATRLVLIQGPRLPDGAKYRITRVDADRALRLVIQCKPAGAA